MRYALVALVILCIPAGYLLYTKYSASVQLRMAEEEAARLDPNWRLAARSQQQAIPDDKNPTLGVQATFAVLPVGWFNKPAFEKFQKPAPQYRLPEPACEALKAELKALDAAVIEARKLAVRFAAAQPAFPPDFSNAGGLQEMRSIASLLDYDALLRAQEGDIDGALTGGQALLNTQRAVREAPSIMRLLMSLAIRQIAMSAIEHALAQGQASPAMLEATQKLFEAEAADGLIVQSLRGERIGSYLKVEEMRADAIASLFLISTQVVLLRLYNQAVEHAKAPAHEQTRLFAAWQEQAKSAPALVKLAAPALLKGVDANLRTEARLRCTVAALAAERFRLMENRWPKTQDELVASKLLTEVLLDPYTGKLLRLRPTNDGLVIHSVGPDQKYAGDALDNAVTPPDSPRYEFRLWNVDRRAQPAPLRAQPGT